MKILVFLSISILFIFFMSCKKDEIVSKTPTPISLEVVSGATGTTKGLKYGKVTDIDGNIYKTIQIGNQIWMAENLNVSRYRNGDSIINLIDDASWTTSLIGAWCYYDNNNSLETTYGKLYNWIAVMDPRGIAPKGWHVASFAEYCQLIESIGSYSISGGSMKEQGITNWISPNSGATNSSGFSARPGGFRNGSGSFSDIGLTANFWATNLNTLAFSLIYNQISCNIMYPNIITGYSVRCVKD